MKNDDLDISEMMSEARSIILCGLCAESNKKILDELNAELNVPQKTNDEIFNEFAVKCPSFINALRNMTDEDIITGLEKMWESDLNLTPLKEIHLNDQRRSL